MAAPALRRVIGPTQVIALSFGAMIGWSWVLLASNWVRDAGTFGAPLAFLIGGFAILCIALLYAELASAMPKAGGEHVYVMRALGPVWSFWCSWALLMAYVTVCVFEAVALPTGVEYLVPEIRFLELWTWRARRSTRASSSSACSARARSPQPTTSASARPPRCRP